MGWRMLRGQKYWNHTPGFLKWKMALLMGIIDYLVQSVCDYILL